MALLPLTAAGVAQKVQELYALTDANLLIQARAITTDIQTWLTGNFILSSQQQAWLTNAPDRVRFSLGALLGATLSAHREITMEDPPVTTGRRTKQIIIDLTGNLTYYPPVSGPGTGGGSLQLNITWRLID